MLVDVSGVLIELVAHALLDMGGLGLEERHLAGDVHDQMEAIERVEHHHVEGVVVVPSSL